MKAHSLFLRLARSLAVLAMLTSASFADEAPVVVKGSTVYRADRILAKPKEKARKGEVSKLEETIRSVGRVRAEYHAMGGLQIIDLAKGQTVEGAIERLMKSGLYEYAEPDYQVRISQLHPNDPLYLSGALWGMHNTGQSNGVPDADIDAPEGWAIRHDASNIIVAVIDTGIDYNHPDLNPNMWRNPNEVVNGLDDDNNGYVDDIYGINCIVPNGNPMDDHYHGTHVAGTIGAVGNNGTGVVGVAWRVQLMGIKFLNSNGIGYISHVIPGIYYAVSNGATILNNSWGGPEYSSALFDAIKWTASNGVMFVAAAGNDNTDTQEVTNYPSGYLVDNVLAVMATMRDDTGAPFSNYGYETVDVAAPGAAIWSTMPTYMTRAMSNDARTVNYASLSGTSMATPMVAGILAILKAHFQGEHYTNLYRRLMSNVDFLPDLEDACFTEGRVNLANSLTNGMGPIPNFVLYPFYQTSFTTYRFTAGDPPLKVDGTNISKWIVSNRWIFAGVHTAHTYHASYTFSNAGLHEIQFDAWSEFGEKRTRTRKVLVDYNYKLVEDIPFRWISPTGHTPLVLGDEDFKTVPLPFPFEFYGVTYTQIFIGANGVVGFISNRMEKTAGGYPPDPDPQNAVIAIYSRDLDPSAPGGSVRYGVIGTAPDRWFVVSYTNVKTAVFNARFTFQAMLSEKTGDIIINHLDLAQNNSEQGGQGAGRFAFVYVENQIGWMCTSYKSNLDPNKLLPDRKSILFTRREVSVFTNIFYVETGNANGKIDQGEIWREDIVLKNGLNTTLTGITAVLSTTNAGIMILAGTNTYPDMAAFALATNTAPFRYKVGNGIACGTVIEFNLAYTANGKTYYHSFWRRVGALNPPVTNVFHAADTPKNTVPGTYSNPGRSFSTNFVNLPGHVVRDVNVSARITHFNIIQLDIFLRSPSMSTILVESTGTGINYGTNECGAANFIPTTWDDEAPVQMFASNFPPYIVTPYRPYQCCLSIFDGQPASGPWVMMIEDTCSTCQGTNMCWWLTIESQDTNYYCNAYAGCEENIPPTVSNLSFTAVSGIGTGLYLTAFDPDSGGLVYQIVSSPSYGSISGFDPLSGAFVYTAFTNYTGPDSFQFRVSDGCVTSETATVTLNVQPPPQYARRIFISDNSTPGRIRVSDDEGVTWVNFVTNLNQVRGIWVSEDGEYLFATTIGDDRVWQYRIANTTLVGQASFFDQTAFNRRPVASFKDGPVHRVYVSSSGTNVVPDGVVTNRIQVFNATGSGLTTNVMHSEDWQAGYLAPSTHDGVTYLLAPGHGANASVRRWVINPDGSLSGSATLHFFAPGGTNKLDPRGIFPIANGAIIPSAHSNQPNGFYVVPMYNAAGNYTAGVIRVYNFGSISNSATDPGEWFFDVSRAGRFVYGISRGGTVDYLYRWEFEPLLTNFTFLGSVQLDGTGGKGFADAYSIAVLQYEVTSGGPTLTPYQIWAQQRITNGQTNELQDADGDGIPNWEEWVTDSNPMVSNAPFAVTAIAVGTNAAVAFPSSTGRLYTLQWTDNLPAHWWSNVAGQVDKAGSGGVTNLFDVPATNAFFRVRVRVP